VSQDFEIVGDQSLLHSRSSSAPGWST
jgi:hypothetical protein